MRTALLATGSLIGFLVLITYAPLWMVLVAIVVGIVVGIVSVVLRGRRSTAPREGAMGTRGPGYDWHGYNDLADTSTTELWKPSHNTRPKD